MNSTQRTSRILGMLLVVQLAGLIVPFALLHPLTRGTLAYLADAAGASFQIKVAVFLFFANGALTIGIALKAMPVFRQYSLGMAQWLVIAGVIMFTLQALDNVFILSMLSLSQRYAQAGGSAELYQALAGVVGSTRRWAHFTELLAIDSWIFLLYALLYRFMLIPRVLAVFGLFTVMLHFIGVPLQLIVGHSSLMAMAVPMAVSHLALVSRLMTRGFEERPRSLSTETSRSELASI